MLPKFAIRLTLFYLFLGITWILGSDRLVQSFTDDPETLSLLQNYKGLFFILVTACSLFLLTKHEEQKRKAIIERLNNALKQAEIASKLKVSFLANISHEIRTPLNAIKGFSQILQTAEIEPETMKEYPHIINKNTDILLQILEIVLEASKLQAETITPDFRKINLSYWLKKNLIDFNKSNSFRLILKTPDPFLDTLPQLNSDPAILSRCLYLLTNGIKRFINSKEINLNVFYKNSENIISLCFSGFYDYDRLSKMADFFQPFNSINERLPNEDFSIGNELYMAKRYGELLQASFYTKTQDDIITFCIDLPILT